MCQMCWPGIADPFRSILCPQLAPKCAFAVALETGMLGHDGPIERANHLDPQELQIG